MIVGAGMSFKKYRGPIETVEHAMMRHAVVTIECQRCTYYTSEYAWKLYNRSEKARAILLHTPVSGFACRQCGPGARAVIAMGCTGGRYTRPDHDPLGLEHRRDHPCRRCGDPSMAATESGFNILLYWCEAHIPPGHETCTYFFEP